MEVIDVPASTIYADGDHVVAEWLDGEHYRAEFAVDGERAIFGGITELGGTPTPLEGRSLALVPAGVQLLLEARGYDLYVVEGDQEAGDAEL